MILLNEQRRNCGEHTGVTGAAAHEDLANVDTGDSAVGLAPGTTHTGLQSIGTGAGQHLVDADDVEGVSADAEVEAVLAGGLDEVLVGANTGGLEGLGAQLLILVGDEVDAEREVVNVGALAAKIEDADLGVGDTAVVPRLGVRLEEVMSVSCLQGNDAICDAHDCFHLHLGARVQRHPSFRYVLDRRCLLPIPRFDIDGHDLGFAKSDAHLVLAVAVATGGTAGHFDGIDGVVGCRLGVVEGRVAEASKTTPFFSPGWRAYWKSGGGLEIQKSGDHSLAIHVA